MGSDRIKLNQEMPPEPFMRRAALEVLSLRKRVKELEEENKSLIEENDVLHTQRISFEESERLKVTIASLQGQLKAYRNDSTVLRLREAVRAHKRHTTAVARRFVEFLNDGNTPRFKDLLELAYIAGRGDETYDFNGFYKDINSE